MSGRLTLVCWTATIPVLLSGSLFGGPENQEVASRDSVYVLDVEGTNHSQVQRLDVPSPEQGF